MSWPCYSRAITFISAISHNQKTEYLVPKANLSVDSFPMCSRGRDASTSISFPTYFRRKTVDMWHTLISVLLNQGLNKLTDSCKKIS